MTRLRKVANEDPQVVIAFIQEILGAIESLDTEIRDVIDASAKLSEMCRSYHSDYSDNLSRQIDNDLVRNLTNVIQGNDELSLVEIKKIFEMELSKFNNESTPNV